MQKNWKMVLLTAFGLILGSFPICSFGNLLWQSLETETSSILSGYDKAFIVNNTPKNFGVEEKLKELIGSKAAFIQISDSQKQFEAMRLSHLSLYISHIPTKDENLNFLTIAAKATVETSISKVDFLSTLWEKKYLIAGNSEQIIQKSLNQSLSDFFSHYFKDNSSNEKKLTFYFFQ